MSSVQTPDSTAEDTIEKDCQILIESDNPLAPIAKEIQKRVQDT